jgi:serine kinase of HPr protein (carbohydrate metabolism regulator)
MTIVILLLLLTAPAPNADDCVEIRQEDQDTLVGNAPDLIEHLLEIRGLGIKREWSVL